MHVTGARISRHPKCAPCCATWHHGVRTRLEEPVLGHAWQAPVFSYLTLRIVDPSLRPLQRLAHCSLKLWPWSSASYFCAEAATSAAGALPIPRLYASLLKSLLF